MPSPKGKARSSPLEPRSRSDKPTDSHLEYAMLNATEPANAWPSTAFLFLSSGPAHLHNCVLCHGRWPVTSSRACIYRFPSQIIRLSRYYYGHDISKFGRCLAALHHPVYVTIRTSLSCYFSRRVDQIQCNAYSHRLCILCGARVSRLPIIHRGPEAGCSRGYTQATYPQP